MAETVSKSMQLLPEYQEKYLKDLLANVFQTNEDTGEISGIATVDPLFGEQYYQTPEGGSTLDAGGAALDAAGEPIQLYEALTGGFTSIAGDAAVDQYENPIFATKGGVQAPDVQRFTDQQFEAIDRFAGLSGYDSMVGSYEPYVDSASELYQSGADLAGSAGTGIFDPQGQIVYDIDPTTGAQTPRLDAEGNPVRSGGYKDYYNPFVEDVIDTTQADMRDALSVQLGQIGADAAGLGAFGNRQAVLEGTAIGKSVGEQGKLGAELRSAGFTGAQTQAQSAFENQQTRGLQAGQLFQGLGTGIGALGEANQAMGMQDVNTLFNLGGLEQGQLQKQYDVQRAGQLEQAYEPFARFSYMRDILSGIPSSGTGLTAAGTPTPSSLSNIMTDSGVYSALGPGLGRVTNTSGSR